MGIANFLLENYAQILIVGSGIISGASIIAAAIAPLTKTDKDDKLARFLKKAHLFISKLALNPIQK
jgi:hypothetical protein